MLEEEHKFRQSMQRTFTLLQFTNILLLLLSVTLTLALYFSITTQETLIMPLALLLGMILFVGLLGYSTYNMQESLADVCFHLALIAVFLALQVAVLLSILISPANIGKIFTPDAKLKADTHKGLIALGMLAILLITV